MGVDAADVLAAAVVVGAVGKPKLFCVCEMKGRVKRAKVLFTLATACKRVPKAR